MDSKTILLELADRMADPDRVVLDPTHSFEDAEGRKVLRISDRPVRACVFGHTALFNCPPLPSEVTGIGWDFTGGKISAQEASDQLRALAQ